MTGGDENEELDALTRALLLASAEREPPEPHIEGELPSSEEFYGDGIPSWVPDRE